MILWSWFFILAFDFKEEVTQTKRERVRQIQAIVHFQKRFLRERESKRILERNPCKNFPEPRRRERARISRQEY